MAYARCFAVVQSQQVAGRGLDITVAGIGEQTSHSAEYNSKLECGAADSSGQARAGVTAGAPFLTEAGGWPSGS